MFTRRQFLKSLILSTVGLGLMAKLNRAETATNKDRPYDFHWRVPKVHFETVKKELTFEGEITEEKDAKGLPLVFIFVGAVLLPYLANAILALRREIVHGGVVIDTRGNKIVIDTDKSLPGGVILVVTSEGTEFYEREQISDPTELVSALMKGVK